ncbi:MAG: recombinase RecA [Kiritimatiellae bacterium]|jgi:recombination protein RecA|nr:recombinase RecA [Kiritimatiellia bacterium]
MGKIAIALEEVMKTIRKEFGEMSILRLGDAADTPVEAIPTGALSLDIALGVGGLPRGRIVECYGHESSGKTTLALHVVANAQKAGGVAAFIDAEHALDPAYAAKIGVDLDSLVVSQPNSGEEALTICEQLAKSGAVQVIVVDSVAALVPQAEIDGDIGDAHVGLQARLMSQAMRKLTSTLSQSNTLCIFTNQVREKIGVMFGNPETTPGGKALKFYATCRLQVQRIGAIKNAAGQVVGNRTRVKVVKNKVAAPFTEAEFDILYECGISREGSILDAAIARGIVEKRGSWLSYGEKQIAQGSLAAIAYLKENPALAEEIATRVKELPRSSPTSESKKSRKDAA